jgi:sulfur-oxidizing protein SoxY
MTVLLSRRLMLGATAGLAVAIAARPARATPESMRAAMRDFAAGAEIREGRVKLEIPPLVENGNSVPTTIAVESPMTEADHVVAIALFNERNPLPDIARFQLGPRCGQAWVSTRIRLGDTQQIAVLAKMSDGSVWSATAELIVTLPACIEG